MSFVYISYGPADRALARSLQSQLADERINAWMDEERESDEATLAVLRSAIVSASAVVAIGRAGLAYADIVQWEIRYAEASGVPVVLLRSADEIPALIAHLAEHVEQHDTLIPLPAPLRASDPPPLRHRRLRQFEWFILVVGLAAVVIWLAQLALLSPTRPGGETTPTPPNTVAPANQALVSESGTPTPSVSRTLSPPATATPTPSPTPTASPSPTATASPTPSLTPTPTPSATPTPTSSATPTPTLSATATATASATATPSPSPTQTLTTTPTSSPTATATPTLTPSTWPTALPGEKWLTNTPGA